MDRLSRILGTFDENLTLLSRELGISAFVDGVNIRLEGEEEAVEWGREVLTQMLRFAESGESIDKGRIIYCIELAKEGRAGDIAAILEGVVAVTSRGPARSSGRAEAAALRPIAWLRAPPQP